MPELSAVELAARLLVAAVLGAAIGAEREVDGQDAGLRTHLMLAMGAGLFGVISVGAWEGFVGGADTNVRVDVTRVASYVAAGIGFLGGGAILKQAGGVRGLTTAASLWVAAATGLAAGLGLWVPAVTATAAALFSLVALRPVRTLMRRLAPRRTGNLVVRLRDDRALPELVRILHRELPATPAGLRAGPSSDGDAYEVVVSFSGADPLVLVHCASRVASFDGVAGVQVGAS